MIHLNPPHDIENLNPQHDIACLSPQHDIDNFKPQYGITHLNPQHDIAYEFNKLLPVSGLFADPLVWNSPEKVL